jgi:hypothetical protein
MTFPHIADLMVPVLSDLDDIPDDLDIHYEDGCHYVRVPIAESEDGRWLIAVDVGYRETNAESPCSGVNPVDYVMFGYEITAIDRKRSSVPTLSPAG